MTAGQRLFFAWVALTVFTAGEIADGTDEKEKVDELIGKLGQGDWQNAIDTLVQIGEPAVEPLIRTLQDRSIKNRAVHARAANALAEIGSQRAVKAAVKSFEDAELNPYVRGSVAMKVAELKPKEAVEVLSRASRDKSQFVRWKCAQALGILGDKKGVDALIRALNDQDQYVRAAAAMSLGQIKAENAGDFPILARTGLHSETELNRTKMITGRSIMEIIELNRLGRFWEHFEYILYNGQKVSVKAEGTKGWQESIFDDEILGKFQIQIQREPNQDEKAFLRKRYPDLTKDQMEALLKKLSYIHISEMAPYYITRYGFYEGHTDYRADSIAIAWIFGIRSLEQIEAAFPGGLAEALTQHFTRETFVRH